MHQPSTQRARSLDALRGLSIFLMILSSAIPFGVLPAWMYHAQVPPPAHVFIPTIPGITWVDLVFPFFLFTMGAAIPIALSRRIERGELLWKIIGGLFLRGLLLAAFAIYDEHIRPYRIDPNGSTQSWLIGLLGFVLLIPMFDRLPGSWSRISKYTIKAGSWIGAIILMALLHYPDGSSFSLYRSDIIILVLSNVAVFGGLVWLASRENVLVRLSFLGLLIALRVSSSSMGWVHDLWQSSPVPWLFRFDFLKYLFIVIPGTIIGDMIVRWMKEPQTGPTHQGRWSSTQLTVIAVLMVLLNVVVVVGMKARWLVGTTVGVILLLLLGLRLFASPGTGTERFLRQSYQWGAYLLLLGLFFEPFEGGIKKDPSTLSYYFSTGGLAIFALIALMIFVDIFHKGRWVNVLIESGQNPLIAYAGINNLIRPLLALTGLGALLETLMPTPWLGVIRGLVVTYLVALSAAVFTKLKIFLRT